MEYIKIDTFDGGSVSGFILSHQRELPKKAILDRYTYDVEYNNYSIYKSIGKTSTKFFIIKPKI